MQPSLFVSHGGGPLPLLNDPNHHAMLDAFDELKHALAKPAAIVIISAHWEAKEFTVLANPNPELYYDYSGFPSEAYNIQYPVRIDLDLAHEIYNMLNADGVNISVSTARGIDHGMFVPLKLLYPDADIPIVPISLNNSFNEKSHIALGEKLYELRKRNILVMGSGMQFHNLSLLFDSQNKHSRIASGEFSRWLDKTLANKSIDESNREKLLLNWKEAPFARDSHPREEHLIPLFVCYGASREPVSEIVKFQLYGVEARCYMWPGI